MQLTEKMELVDIGRLVPYTNNARTHSTEQIKKLQSSLREFGFVNPVLVDRNYGIIAGHGRVEAAKREGITAVPCVMVEHLTEAQKKAYILADNRLAMDAGWDTELLKVELQELKDFNFDLDVIGFSDIEIEELLEEHEDAQEDDFDADAAFNEIDVPITSRGDVWKLGKHRLMCGDSTSAADVQKLMDGSRADLLLTDPPYNVDYEGGTKDKLKIKNDSMADDAFRMFLADAFAAANEVMKPGAVFYIWHSDSEGYNFRGACRDVGWQVRQCLIWNKNSLVMGRQDYQWKHEPCLYGWKDGAAHLWATDRKQTTVIDFDRPQKSDLHPTMKPVGLFDYQIQNNTKGDDIVLDPFLGSGTTIVACEQNGRICYGLELDEKYCDVIVKRWEALTGKKAELLDK